MDEKTREEIIKTVTNEETWKLEVESMKWLLQSSASLAHNEDERKAIEQLIVSLNNPIAMDLETASFAFQLIAVSANHLSRECKVKAELMNEQYTMYEQIKLREEKLNEKKD